MNLNCGQKVHIYLIVFKNASICMNAHLQLLETFMQILGLFPVKNRKNTYIRVFTTFIFRKKSRKSDLEKSKFEREQLFRLF